MKAQKSIAQTSEAKNTPTPGGITVAQYDALRDANEEATEKTVEQINVIRDYDERGHFGIGYLDGKLIEFAARRQCELRIQELSLRESVRWLIDADNFIGRYTGSSTTGDGFEIWLEAIHTQLR